MADTVIPQQVEQIVEIPLAQLHPFEGHPFKVQDDDAMLEMADSIRQYGVLVPGIVRPDPEGGYEMIACHRRHRASQLAGKETMPVIVRNMDDDAAIIIMVDSNLQRENILPSERAFAYKMKLDALKHQGKRLEATSSQVGTKMRSDEMLAQQVGSSRNQVQRYIRLTELIKPLLDMKNVNIKRLLILNLPYLLIGLYASKLGQAYRLAAGSGLSDKLLHIMDGFAEAFQSPLPSFHPADLLVGLCCGAALRLAVYIKSKNARKFRKNMEYGSARWGTHDDIAPYIDPVFQNNVILTQTERLTMNSRPKDPKTARNKNVLIIGGSGSGKTRFWLKPNLMQMHSSYVVTDPNGYTVRG